MQHKLDIVVNHLCKRLSARLTELHMEFDN